MKAKKPSDFVTTYKSITGWNAVHVWWNDEEPGLGFWEPYDLRRVQSSEEASAIEVAQQWAKELSLPYKPREGA